MASKGKAIADGKGKRKRDDSDRTGRRKTKTAGVLRFFDDAAYEVDESDSSMDSLFGDDDFLEDEFDAEVKVKSEPGKTSNLPFFPKEEEMTEEELEKMLEERYKPGSSFVAYAEDRLDTKRSVDGNTMMPSRDPIIWKVKCMVGRERHSAFCLMQKYVDLQSLGIKLQIISAFALEHVKGAIYIEADRQSDISEACNGLCSIYGNRMTPVPQNEASHLFSIRSKSSSIAAGAWARVKSGKYKGDLAQVMAVNDVRKKVTVKLVPRIDLQALAAKFGGGVTGKKAAASAPGSKVATPAPRLKTPTPAPRLISSSELEEFRPLIQHRRDRDTDKFYEILDGMMLNDGYLYKKVPIDSLSFFGVLPSEDELLKFESSRNEESNDAEWLSQLYGEQDKKYTVKGNKGGGKGEGSTSSSMENGFQVHDMVFFSRTGFGVIIGTEKDDSFKVLKEGSEGPVVVNLKPRELKKASFDKKFTALDHHRKILSINDSVRILEGSLEGRQGIVRHIYRGTVFLYDELEQENGGYLCSKAQNCEKIKFSSDACKAKGGEPASSGFDDIPSSPKSPLSPKKPWQERDDARNFNQGDKDGMFSVGQSLRIRVGPLKGYLCRVLALRRSDVTVKLDSQQKILTVKPEHLAEVRTKTSVVPMGDNSESMKPFDLLGTQGGSGGWMDGAGTSTEAEGWGAGGMSTERSSWPSFPSSNFSLQPESGSADPLNTMDIDKDVGGSSAWETKAASTQDSAWGAAVAGTEQVGGWGNKVTSDTTGTSDGWGRAKVSVSSDQNSAWGAAVAGASTEQAGGWGTSDGGWGKATSNDDGGTNWGSKSVAGNDTAPSWGKSNQDANDNNQDEGWKKSVENPSSSWDNSNSWGKGKTDEDGSSGSKAVWNTSTAPEKETGGWGNAGGGSTGGRSGGRGGYGGRGGGGNCYKCGESGHMARECTQGGGGGGNCYKCGESGHMARECTQGGGGGGNACFKCGETGHMARECTQGGGGSGGNACYKCGETGHMARECPQGGGGGSKNACYKCGETGHMARECPQGGGGGSKNACYKCGETGHMARDCTQVGGGSGGNSWSSSFTSQKSSWGDDNKSAHANAEQVGGWGKSDGGWGTAKLNPPDSAASWGSKTNDATTNNTQEGDGWKKSEEASWGDKGKNTSSSWVVNNANVNSSWGNKDKDGSSESKAAWNSSTATAEKDTGGWSSGGGGWSAGGGGRSDGRGGGRGGYGGRGGGGNCFKCGESGHMARECTQGGGGGGGNCYKCGESGHMARECTQGGGGGGGGNACFKCGETGHMARECTQGGGGRNACYKCGETGHMARECTQGGGGGGGRYGGNSWSSSTFSAESGSANPNDLKKEDSAWGTKNSSWGAPTADNTEQVGGWGKSDGGWNKSGSSSSGGWGKAKASSGDNQPDSSKDAGGAGNNQQDGGWKKSNQPWGSDTAADKWNSKESSGSGNKTGWSTSGATTEKQTEGWGNASGSGGGGWSGGGGSGWSGAGGGRGGGNGCFKCGEGGHFARECPNSNN